MKLFYFSLSIILLGLAQSIKISKIIRPSLIRNSYKNIVPHLEENKIRAEIEELKISEQIEQLKGIIPGIEILLKDETVQKDIHKLLENLKKKRIRESY